MIFNFFYRLQNDYPTVTDVVIIAILGMVLLGLAVSAALKAQDYFWNRRIEVSYGYTPITPKLRIFVRECLQEEYSVGQCYTSYVRGNVWGSEVLEMPKNWC